MFLKLVARLGLALLLIGGPLASQEESSLTEREEVTAIDLVVELSKDGETAIEPPEDLTPGGFSLQTDGRSLAVVGVEGAAGAEPWHLLLYFDYSLSSAETIRWAASALADRAGSLTELGEVAVIVADPEPRSVLAPTRDANLVDQTLSGIFLKAEPSHRILSQREEFVLQREKEGGEELSGPGIAQLLAAEEWRLVVQQQDALLNTLVTSLPGTARRAVFLVSDGFDQRPEEFYGSDSTAGELPESRLERETEEWAKTITAYGWSVIAVVPEEQEQRRHSGLVPAQSERTWGVNLPGVTARLEGSLDPERAAALHELGQRLSEQGQSAEAVQSLEKALSFYDDHPKYVLQRAAVMIDIGGALLDLEHYDKARKVLREAVSLDPGRADEVPFVQAGLGNPIEPLESLATFSGGRVAETGEGLSSALAALARRVRLTFQFRGMPDGEIHSIQAELPDSGLTVRGPSWIRFGTPETVSALRVRRLLAGEFEQGDLAVKCMFKETSREYSGRDGLLQIQLKDPAGMSAEPGAALRLTIGLAAEEGPSEIRVLTVALDEAVLEVPLTVADEHVWLTVVVDDVAAGRWGGGSTEL